MSPHSLAPRGVRARAGWVGWLFLVLALLYVVPFWVVTYIPTVDGPCHTYNAWILRQYHNTREYPLFSRYYQLDLRPHPNWTGHAVMALLMVPFEPRTAEKILVSGYVWLFLGAVWYLAGAVEPERRAFAFLGFPFVFNHLFQMGFYNFCFSLGFFLLAVAYWWRHRARAGPGFAVTLNLILFLCYFSHIVSLVLALASIGVLWLTTLRRETWGRHLLHVPILAPQVVLPLWFLRVQGAEPIPETSSEPLLRYLRRLEVLVSFSEAQVRLGSALVILFLLLLAFSLAREHLSWTGRLPRWRFRSEDGFLLLSVLVLVLYFAGPAGGSGGTMLKPRLSLYAFLLLIPWFSARMARPVRAAGVGVLALVALLNLGYVVRWYRVLDGEMKTFLAGLKPVRPDTRLLPLVFKTSSSAAWLGIFGHAVDYAAIEKGLVDWDNYEAGTDLFPVRFKPGLKRPTIYEIEASPGSVQVDAYREQVDYVYLWEKPPALWIPRLQRYYARLGGEGPGQLYRRKTPEWRRVVREGSSLP